MLYPEHGLTGASFTPPAGHFWHGWRYDILGPATPGAITVGGAPMPDVWIEQRTRLSDGRHADPKPVHGYSARDWFKLPQPTYTVDHARQIIVRVYWNDEELERARVAYAAGRAYDVIIEGMRHAAAASCQGQHGGAIGFYTRGGKIIADRPLALVIPLATAAKMAFPLPGKAVQLSLF
jgi:hypothetical protein